MSLITLVVGQVQRFGYNSAHDRESRRIGVTAPTVAKAIQHLEVLGMVREISGRWRNRLYIYTDYMNIMERGTEPL